MLTTEQIAQFKERLSKERAILEEELGKLGTRNPSNLTDWVANKPDGEIFGADKSDNADIIEAQQENNATMNELEGRLNLVLKAQGKIEAGTFGTCEVSGEDIEIQRLEANPAARTSMAHMDKEAFLS
ncbi:MAG: TraR/DksA C4-type zinc finger protein [Patescibacteria group bacterium]